LKNPFEIKKLVFKSRGIGQSCRVTQLVQTVPISEKGLPKKLKKPTAEVGFFI
jgi:hypothetical protein